MFDDLKQSNNNQVSQSSPSAISKSSGGVDDMFGDVDPIKNAGPSQLSAVQSGKIKPVSQTSSPTSSMSSIPAMNMSNNQPPKVTAPNIPSVDTMMVSDDRSSGAIRKIIIALLVVFLLAIVGGGVYYFFFRTNPNSNLVNENQNVNNNVNGNVDINIKVNDTNTNDISVNDDNIVIDEDALDEDFDGLTNGEEKMYGTNPLEVDSDNDGLFDQDEIEIYNTDPLADDSDSDGLSDYQEIIVYKTDPNDPDTDGDNFTDGMEIANGYNPLGAGKLEIISEENDNSNVNLNTNENL